ncbi:Hydrogenase-4 component G [bioreactor metagenome]|uniref:Hydrogenase-4 component G n=1 Tax=bioreactor metagenome TaxID=1076179 RepID=A0A644XHT2_9ZZZZ
MNQNYVISDRNPALFTLAELPVIDYVQFFHEIGVLLKNESNHVVSYFCLPEEKAKHRYFCFVADDLNHQLKAFSFIQPSGAVLESLTPVHNALHIFEREIHENYGTQFSGHPWLKPVRWPHNRADKNSCMDNYPFFRIDSEELHEVGVGPVHAGVIEPGHFRFICNGEKVHHLEIHLGYQHRGVEELMVNKKSLLQKAVLSENIAGDTAVGHSLCHAQLIEKLGNFTPSENMQLERALALELERIAVHLGDTAALCGDVAYQLGQVVCESLRTIVINTTQFWCGNRFGKGFIRAGGSHYPMTEKTAAEILKNISIVEKRFSEMASHLYSMPGALSRFDEIGTVTKEQGLRAGLTGMAARMCGIPRDIRTSHPFQAYSDVDYKPVTFESGDVLARALMRRGEIMKSVEIVKMLVEKNLARINNPGREQEAEITPAPYYKMALAADSICISMTEGWRGEIVHVAVTDQQGEIIRYKITDPSLHNWTGLALAVRNQEISDFPVCNKSFNLSYCGYDL